MHIRLFGDFQLLYEGEALTGVDSPRLQSLLAYLLEQVGYGSTTHEKSCCRRPNSMYTDFGSPHEVAA
jgi:hypothetical protein